MTERHRQQLEDLWPRVLPFALQMEANLTTTAPLSRREALLVESLRELEATLTPIRSDLERLWAAFNIALPQAAAAVLNRLALVARSDDAVDFYHRAREAYGTPEAFIEDLASYRRLRELAANAEEIVAARVYLDAVSLPEAEVEMAMDRDSIMSQMNPEELAAQPHRWAAVKFYFDWFHSHYRTAYQTWHRDHYRQVAALAAELEHLEPEIDALERLNSIAELGEPLGQDLLAAYRGLRAHLEICSAEEGEDALAIDAEPRCLRCRQPMTTSPPTDEVAALVMGVHRALAKQQRRLSSEALREILSRSGEDRLLSLIQVVQTADLSALINVLDDELAAFLRGFLAERQAYVASSPARAIRERDEYEVFTASPAIFERLADRFPTVEEEQRPAVVAELASLLEEAFEEAKREQPGRKLRLRLE